MAWLGPKSAVGLVLRNHEVQVLGLQGKTVTCRVRIPFGAGASSLAESIRKAVEMAGLHSAKLPVSIQSPEILFRFFTIPAVPRAECDTAVQFEARRYIPFKIESLLWDYRAIPSPANPKRMDVIFAAMPREVFERAQDALTAAGVQPTRIEPMHVSLARLVELGEADSRGEFVCVVDVDEDTAHLAIVKRRMPYLTRDISLLPSAEMPPAPVEPLQASQDLDPRAKRLLSELSVSMDFFVREYPSTTVAKVWLCGDENRIGPWCGWLTEQLRCPVQAARPLVQSRVPDEVPLSFASAIGLVAGAAEPGEGSIDLLHGVAKQRPVALAATPAATPVDLHEQVVALLKTPQAITTACAVAVLLGGLWVLESIWVDERRNELNQVRSVQVAPGLGLQQAGQEALDGLKQRLDAQVSVVKQIIEQRPSIAAKLDGLVRALPEGVWITSFALDDELNSTGESQPKLMLNGACFLGEPTQELVAIQRFETQLKQHEQFFAGFASAQLDEITVQSTPLPPFRTYRTFLLNCDGRRRM